LGDQESAVVAALPEGGLIVAWYDRGCSVGIDAACAAPFDDADAIYARRFDANGDPVDAEQWRVNTDLAGAQTQLTVAADSDGNVTIAWSGHDAEGVGGVWLRRFAADGTPLDPEDVRIFAGGTETESPAAGMDAAGNLAAAWSVVDRQGPGTGNEVFGLYFPAGGASPVEIPIAGADAADRRWPSLDMNAAGEMVIVFAQSGGADQFDSGSDVYARRYAPGATPLDATPVLVNQDVAGEQPVGRVAIAGSGSYLVAWMTDSAQVVPENGFDILAQSFNSDGEPATDAARVNSTIEGDQKSPSVGMAAASDGVIVWAGKGTQPGDTPELGDQSDDEGVFLQQLDFLSPVGEIEVRGKGVIIEDGDDSPSDEDGTKLGDAVVKEGKITRQFVINNIGDGRLWFIGEPSITVSGESEGEFTVSDVEVTSIAAHSSIAFTLSFSPSAIGSRKATIVIMTDDGDETPFEFTVEGNGLEPQKPWQNPHNPFDVNGDGVVTGLDALILINHLNKNGPHGLPAPEDGNSPPPYLDVNGDNQLTALDALQTINVLNSRRPPLAGSQRAQPAQGMLAPVVFSTLGSDKSRRSREPADPTDAVFATWTASTPERPAQRRSIRLG
jgi:hypothetical protein